jgi:glycosyltransferase involved in cell wall biosynthesis
VVPVVSVIIPTRNRPDFLKEAIESVIVQDCQDFELLLVNDGDALAVPIPDRRIHVLDNNTQGAVSARNLGVKTARGDFIAFLDDDDVWINRQHLSSAIRALNRTADFYFADGLMSFPGEEQPRRFAHDANAKTLETDNTILVSSICYKRKLHAALGLFDVALPYYWDWDWYLRVARDSFRFFRDMNPAVNIRVHEHNMSGGNADEREKNLVRFSLKHGIGPLTLKNHTDFSTVEKS